MYPPQLGKGLLASLVTVLVSFISTSSSVAIDIDNDGFDEVFVFQDQMVKMLSPTGQVLERMPLPPGLGVSFGVSEVYPAIFTGQPAAAVLTVDLTQGQVKPAKLTFFSAGGFIGDVNVGSVTFSYVFVYDIDKSGTSDVVTVNQKTGAVQVVTDPNTTSSQVLAYNAPSGSNRQYSIIQNSSGPQLAAFLFGKSSNGESKNGKSKKKRKRKKNRRVIAAESTRKLKTGSSKSIDLLHLLTGARSSQTLSTKINGAVLPFYSDSVMAIQLKTNSGTITTLDLASGFSTSFNSEILATVSPGKFLEGSSQQALLVRNSIVEIYDLANATSLGSFDYTLVEGGSSGGGLGGGGSEEGFTPSPKMQAILDEIETLVQAAAFNPFAVGLIPAALEKYSKVYFTLNTAQQDYYQEQLDGILSLIGGSFKPLTERSALQTSRVIAPNDFNFVLGPPVYVPQTIGRDPNLPFFCNFIYNGIGDFLWKPVSENDGRPVSLGIGGTQVVLRAKGSGKIIAKGKNTGPSNGRVDTHRFPITGGEINKRTKNKGFYIVVKEGFRAGGCIFIKDATERVER